MDRKLSLNRNKTTLHGATGFGGPLDRTDTRRGR